MSLSVVVVLGLAAARLWRIIAIDDITDRLRDLAFGSESILVDGVKLKHNARPRLVEFATCPWCLGLWVALAIFAVYRLAPDDVVAWVVGVLAVSEVVGLAVRNLDPSEE